MVKKLLLSLAMAACICVMPVLSVAAENAENTKMPERPASIEMEWQRLHDTWQNLSKRQKEQLYKAREAVDKADCNFIDKAVEFELIDKQIGERMKDHIKARTARIRQDGDLPMFRRGIRQKPQQQG
ncbi:MAG: hypothetical protein FWD03_05195 [Defluviitaleaceae bacterium]|nr:hypothetical protein [Defluviitaleaceae bacterium]